VIFGSQGTAQADFERMEEINQEIGLNSLLHTHSGDKKTVEKPDSEKEQTFSHGESEVKEKET